VMGCMMRLRRGELTNEVKWEKNDGISPTSALGRLELT
jgi:hypothetical protein